MKLAGKCGLFVLAGSLLAASGTAQRKPERPRVHADFYFGSSPTSREAADFMANTNARLVVTGLHAGWDVEKIAKETKVSADDLQKTFDELEEQRLVGSPSADDSVRPYMPVIRERDIERLRGNLDRYSDEFVKTVQANWKEIEAFAASLPAAKDIPKPQLMYQVVVSGILLGGMEDAFFEDKTLMPPGPRRTKGQRFFAWLVEGDPVFAGALKRELRESDGYSIISIGTVPLERVSLEQIRQMRGMLLDQAEAARFRNFVSILCRDKLLPFFKRNRADFFKIAAIAEASKYSAFAEMFAWYYNQIANNVAAKLAASGSIAPPTGQYTYAIKLPL